MKNFRFLIILSFAMIMSSPVFSQGAQGRPDITGTWMGAVKAGAIEPRLVFNIRLENGDSLVATLDSPDQGAKGIPLGNVIYESDTLVIYAPLLLGQYRGLVVSDTLIEGSWTQRGQTFPLILNKLQDQFVVNRPQEPKEPFPYAAVEVKFPNTSANIFLAGTLTIPEGTGPFPAVILITGSGAQDRDETIMAHKPFLVIADYLTRHGIAVLRYDDRGVARSQGSQLNATSADFAGDAQAAFDFLKQDSRIDPGKIGLAGHSEGGLIAPIVASSNNDIAFIISLAGPGVNGEELLLRQQRDIAQLMGASEDEIKDSYEINKKLYKIIRKEKDNQEAQTKAVDMYRKLLKKKGMSDSAIDEATTQLLAQLDVSALSWFRYFISTDPARYWSRVLCPVLALNGEKDVQVAADVNLPAIEKALRTSGNNNVKTVSLPGLNHLFQHCTTGLPSEYSKIEETISPEVLEIMASWITSLPVTGGFNRR